jgi:hypothetical protein
MIAIVAVASVAFASPVVAGQVSIAGLRSHINIINPPGTGRCASIPRVPPYAATVDIVPGPGIPSSTGTSNLGGFEAMMSHCIISAPPTPFEQGIFSWEFEDGDLLEGTYVGEVFLTGTPNLFDAVITYTVTGGTGRFAGGSGTMNETGSFVRMPNPIGPGFITDWDGSYEGRLSLPAIPEPGTWAMLIAGFGIVGAATRRRRAALA